MMPTEDEQAANKESGNKNDRNNRGGIGQESVFDKNNDRELLKKRDRVPADGGGGKGGDDDW